MRETLFPEEGGHEINGNQESMIYDDATGHKDCEKRFLPLLLASALACSMGFAVTSDAQEEPKEARTVEDPNIAALWAQMTKLIADLDSKEFTVRAKAHKELEEFAVDWVKMRKKTFPLESLLTAAKGQSLEQSRRLERISESYENEKGKLLWLPTKFQVPEVWKEWKTPPPVSEVLKELEVQSGRSILLKSPKDVLERPMKEALREKTLLEVLEAVRRSTGDTYVIAGTFDESLSISDPSKNELYGFFKPLWTWTDAKGSVLVQLSGGFPEDTRKEYKAMGVKVLTERKLILDQARVVSGVGTTDTGQGFSIEDNTDHQFPQSGQGLYIYVPTIPEVKTARISLTVECIGYAPVSVPIVDVKKGQEIKTQVGALQLHGVSGTTERRTDQRMIWQVKTTTPEDYSYIVSRIHLIRCRAFNAKGQPIRAYGSGSQNGPAATFEWEFWEEPFRIEFIVPERSTMTTETFTFSNVSLVQRPH